MTFTRRVTRHRAAASNLRPLRWLVVRGRVAGAHRGRVAVRLRHRTANGHWVFLRLHVVRLASDGTFRARFGFRRSRLLLVRAVYRGSATAAPSRTKLRRVRS